MDYRYHSPDSKFKGTTHLGVLALLGLLVAAAYFNSLRNGFVGDDLLLIVRNQGITRIENLPGLLASDYWTNYRGPHEAAPSQSSGLYRPLTLASYALNYAMGGLDPMGYHLVNGGLHLLVTWMVFLVAVRVGIAREPAIVAAVIFAVHPLHTEAVTQVVGRAELLMSLGMLGAVWFALARRHALALVAFAGALFSKEQATVLPVLLIAQDLGIARASGGNHAWPGWRAWVSASVPKYGAYLLVLAGYLAIRAKVLGGFPLPPVSPVENPLAFLDWAPRLLTALKIAGYYLGLFIWPADLLADYSGHTISVARSVLDPGVLWGLGAWGSLAGLAAWSWVRGVLPVWFSLALTGLTFLPVSNVLVPIGTIMAERLFYLPSAGLCLLAGLAYERATGQRHPSPVTHHSSLITRHLSLVLVVLICLAMTVRTVIRNQDWRDAESLFRQAVVMAPENAKAYVFLGGALAKKGQHAQALEAYDTAARLYPDYLRADSFFNSQRGILLIRLGRTPEAVDALEQAATLDPNWGAIRIDLGLAYATMGNYERAEATLRQALSITPGSPHGHSSLSLILNEQGRYAEALAAAEAALERDPTHLWARFNRASALEGLGRREEAVAAYEGVLSLTPGAENRRAFDEAKERLAHLRE